MPILTYTYEQRTGKGGRLPLEVEMSKELSLEMTGGGAHQSDQWIFKGCPQHYAPSQLALTTIPSAILHIINKYLFNFWEILSYKQCLFISSLFLIAMT